MIPQIQTSIVHGTNHIPSECMPHLVELGLNACLKRKFFPVTAILRRIIRSALLAALALLSNNSGRLMRDEVLMLLKISKVDPSRWHKVGSQT